MESSYRCQNWDERETWLEQSLYAGRLTALNRVEINRIDTCIK